MSAVLIRSLARFRDDERGAATIELVVWLPFFFLLFFVVVDASVFFWRYSAMWDVTRDAAREVTIRGAIDPRSGTFQSELDAYVHSRLSTDYNARAVDILAPDPGIEISTELRNLTVLGFLGVFVPNNEIVTTVRMRYEPN